jgi:hypothetical protein
MTIPAGITTALVHMDAPVSFTGAPGRLQITITPSIPLVWAATGTPVADFIDVEKPANGESMEVDLPHTDQDGFLDGSGNAYINWSYRVKVKYEKGGQVISFPDRDFQIPTGQTTVDLALIPAGTAVAAPQIAPILPVTSVNGRTGMVFLTLADVGLTNVDNTSDMDKPISTATLTAIGEVSLVAEEALELAQSATGPGILVDGGAP